MGDNEVVYQFNPHTHTHTYTHTHTHKQTNTNTTGSTSAVRQCLLIGLATRLAYRLPRANGYKTMGRTTTLAQLHPTTAHVGVDEDGLLPKWVVYNELISTSSVFLSKVGVVVGLGVVLRMIWGQEECAWLTVSMVDCIHG